MFFRRKEIIREATSLPKEQPNQISSSADPDLKQGSEDEAAVSSQALPFQGQKKEGKIPFEQKRPQREKKHLHSAAMARRRVTKTTQNFLDIVGIRNSVVVMRDGTLRAILMVSSTNFALKSQDEQNSIIYAYQGLLNSLNFPVQFVIQSRELNIEPYLKGLEELEKKQANELLRVQTIEYREFVAELVEWGQIMRKRFYVVIPYSWVEAKEQGVIDRIKNLFRPAEVIRQSERNFQKYKSLLDQRSSRMEGLLNAVGLKSVRLNTQELIELFYNVYNPLVSNTQPLTDVRELNVI